MNAAAAALFRLETGESFSEGLTGGAFCLTKDGAPAGLESLPFIRAANERARVEEEFDARLPGGRVARLRISAAPALHRDGNLRGVVAAVTDITRETLLVEQKDVWDNRLRSIIDSNFVPLVFWDRQARVTDANQAFLDLLGYTRDQLLSSRATLFDLTPPALRFADYHALGDLEAGRTVTPYEKEMLTSEQRRIPVLAGAGQFGDGGVSFIFDLTARKELERKLNESTERLLLAQEGNRLGTFEWNLVTTELQWSPELEAIYGLEPGTFEGDEAAWQRRVPPEEWRRLEQERQQGVKQFRPNFNAEFQINHADGKRRWIEVRGRIAYSIGAAPLRIVGIQQDITSRKEIELELARTRAELETYTRELELRVEERTAHLRQNLQTLESLTYTIAHDLRAPLRAMQGFATALNEEFGDRLGEIGESYTRRIRRACFRMDALVADLLSYARIGHAETASEIVDLSQIFDAFTTNHADSIAAHNATISVERSLPRVKGSRTLLPHVIDNLLLNAMKFVAPGVDPQIKIWAKQANGSVRLNIEDNGIGIDPQYHGKIFEIFQRLHAPEEYSGTGVGLAIVRKAVERMNGAVGVESEKGSGSRFWIELPAATPL